MHGSNRLGGNSLGDLLVFGKRAGEAAAAYVAAAVDAAAADERQVDAAARAALAPFERHRPARTPTSCRRPAADDERPRRDHPDARGAGAGAQRAARGSSGGRRRRRGGAPAVQPRLAPGAGPALTCCWSSECIARAALERTESRGGHTRDDYPNTDDAWGRTNIVLTRDGRPGQTKRQPLPQMPRRPGASSSRRGTPMSQDVTMRVWRGTQTAATSLDYAVPVEEGKVVLDAIHRIQADPGRRPRLPVELQGRQVRVLQRRDQRQAAADVHDAAETRWTEPSPSPSTRCGPSRSSGTWSPTSRSTTSGPAGAGVHPGAARRGGHVPDAAGRRRAVPGVPQVHRVLPLPERLPRHARPRGNKEHFAGPRFFVRYAELEMHPLDTLDRRRARQEHRASATATSPSAAPRSARRTSRSPTTRSSR